MRALRELGGFVMFLGIVWLQPPPEAGWSWVLYTGALFYIVGWVALIRPRGLALDDKVDVRRFTKGGDGG